MTFPQTSVQSNTSALDIEKKTKASPKYREGVYAGMYEGVYQQYFQKLMQHPNERIYALFGRTLLENIPNQGDTDTVFVFSYITYPSLVGNTASLTFEGLTRLTIDALIDAPLDDIPLSEHKVRIKLTFAGKGEPSLKSEVEFDPYDKI